MGFNSQRTIGYLCHRRKTRRHKMFLTRFSLRQPSKCQRRPWMSFLFSLQQASCIDARRDNLDRCCLPEKKISFRTHRLIRGFRRDADSDEQSQQRNITERHNEKRVFRWGHTDITNCYESRSTAAKGSATSTSMQGFLRAALDRDADPSDREKIVDAQVRIRCRKCGEIVEK